MALPSWLGSKFVVYTVPSDTTGCQRVKASDVHARFPCDGAEAVVVNEFVSSAPYCVHAPVGTSGRDVFESDNGSTDRQPESTLAPTTAVVDKKVRLFISRYLSNYNVFVMVVAR
jgi:hypothetical protein